MAERRANYGGLLKTCVILLAFAPGYFAFQTHIPDRSATHAYGAWSLLPALIAILAAIVFREVYIALLLAIFTGAFIFTQGNIIQAGVASLERFLWGAIKEEEHLRMLAFTALMGAMVGVLTRSGGMQGLVNLLLPIANNRKAGQLTGWATGLVIFFDDYSNTIVLGNTLRPIMDRLKISRAKLAFIVDATAATVASIALLSTWIALEISLIQDALQSVGIYQSAYLIFLQTIPYRFYVLWMLFFVAFVAVTGKDFGPMLKAEQKAQNASEYGSHESRSLIYTEVEMKQGAPPRWTNAMITLLVLIGMFFWLLAATGYQKSVTHENPLNELIQILGAADSYLALFYASLAGLLTAVLLSRSQNILSHQEAVSAIGAGAKAMIPGLTVLPLAWALAAVMQTLQAGPFLATLLKQTDGSSLVMLELLPTVVFLISAAISFATGTSWGTMGIMIPITVTVVFELLDRSQSVTGEEPLLLAAIGSVLAGAVFGDHCSPISDTTVLSSQASGCDHLEHVATQMPYAILVAGVTILAGTLPVGCGLPVWISSLIGLPLLLLILIQFGRQPEIEKRT